MSSKTKTSKTITFRAPLSLVEFLEKEADQEYRTVSNYLLNMIEQKRREKESKKLPTANLSTKKITEIESILDEYHKGNIPVEATLSSSQDIQDYFDNLDQK